MKSHRGRLFAVALLSFLTTTGFVKPITVNLQELPQASRWSALPAADQKKALKTLKDPLARAGVSEALQDWEGCVTNARKVSPKSSIMDWALLLELNCAQSLVEENKKGKGSKNAGELLRVAIQRVETHAFDPFSRVLQDKKIQAVLSARLALCRWYDKHARWKDLKKQLDKALKQENFYAKNDKALLYYFAGDVMVAERFWSDALWQFQRAHDLNPNAEELDQRLKAILPMVPKSIRDQFEEALKPPPENTPVALSPSGDELEMANQAEEILLRNDATAAAGALAKLMKKYPGGVRAKWAQDKMLELLNGEIAKSKGPEGDSVAKKHILSEMADFDADRMYDWGKALFDSQNYSDAGTLLKKAADQIAGSARASKDYYLAARAYQLGNDLSDAKSLYQLLVQNYPAAPEVTDGAIQWALININENDPSEAITHLEIARSRKMSNQQDLISLFWLYEAYKMKNATPNMTDTGNELVRRFGLTYYGVIAFEDLKKQLPTYEKSKTKQAKVFLSEAESHALERAQALLSAGLLDQASEELAIFSNRPLSGPEQQYLANYYAQALHYQRAFTLINNLVDEAPDKRTDYLVRLLFPKEYFNLVSDDKKRSNVDPLLLLSVMKQESAFDHGAISRSGAIGLLQMIPPTAQEVKHELNSDADVPKALFDPAVNVKYCAHYLAHLINKYNGSIPLALAAYNAGPTRVTQFVNSRGGVLRDTWVDELPWAETSFYVKSILKNYLLYRMLYGGLDQLPTPPWSAAKK